MKLIESRRLDGTLAALADGTRRAILERLTHSGEARITELAAPFSCSLNAISKHIKVLERAGLVRRRKQWREHWVSIDPKPLDQVAQWIETTKAFWNARLDALEAAIRTDELAALPPTSTPASAADTIESQVPPPKPGATHEPGNKSTTDQ